MFLERKRVGTEIYVPRRNRSLLEHGTEEFVRIGFTTGTSIYVRSESLTKIKNPNHVGRTLKFHALRTLRWDLSWVIYPCGLRAEIPDG